MSLPADAVYHCEYAWTGGPTVQRDVEIEVRGGRIERVEPAPASPPNPGMTSPAAHAPKAIFLTGLTLPGLVNTHSHVFHRAIRGRTQSGAADFWQWRKTMYQAASRLNPGNLYALARATYAEMLLAGITAVGEFFYVHHPSDGSRYADPNEMGLAVIHAAVDAGIRITLLDTCYLQAGVDGAPPEGAQIRYDDGSWQAWADRVDALRESSAAAHDLVTVGAAIHSVRAVPRQAMAPIAAFCRSRSMPVHAHLSEQPAENEACLAVHGLTPTELLAAEQVLSPAFTAVHATHLTDQDISLLGAACSSISMCPTTERDLADGVGPAIRLSEAGCRLTVGSDGHMMIDLLEEGRAIELNERLVTGKRGHLTAEQIARALTVAGATSIGQTGATPSGLAVGAQADLTTIRLDSVRMAGARSGNVLAHALFSATASDVENVILGGRVVVENGTYLADPHPGRSLDTAISALAGSVC